MPDEVDAEVSLVAAVALASAAVAFVVAAVPSEVTAVAATSFALSLIM